MKSLTNTHSYLVLCHLQYSDMIYLPNFSIMIILLKISLPSHSMLNPR